MALEVKLLCKLHASKAKQAVGISRYLMLKAKKGEVVVV